MRLATIIYHNPEVAAIGLILAATLGRVTPACLVQIIYRFSII